MSFFETFLLSLLVVGHEVLKGKPSGIVSIKSLSFAFNT